jgi:outer membrane lipoprotein-sorting protein
VIDKDRSETDVQRDLADFGESLRENVSLTDRVLGQLDLVSPPAHDQYTSLETKRHSVSWVGGLTMLQKLSIGSLSAVLMLAFGLWMVTSTSGLSFAQVAESVREAKSYSFVMNDFVYQADESKGRTQMSTGRFYWQSPGSHRMETKTIQQQSGEPPYDLVRVFFTDRAGVSWDNQQKTYKAEPPMRGRTSPLMAVQKLATYSGSASKILGTEIVSGVACTGFEIPLGAIDASAGKGKMIVWVDPHRQLPVMCRLLMGEGKMEVVMEDFVWNEPIDQKLFDGKPPAGYAAVTPRATPPDQQVEKIVSALRFFAELNDGRYPEVEVIYGDVTRDTLLELAGFGGKELSEYIREKDYERILEATGGFGTMNVIQRNNADAEYNGLQVTPSDKDAVLFRWRLDDGTSQIIYGDLHTERK